MTTQQGASSCFCALVRDPPLLLLGQQNVSEPMLSILKSRAGNVWEAGMGELAARGSSLFMFCEVLTDPTICQGKLKI